MGITVRVLALAVLLSNAVQAGGIRTFHSYHGTGRSPCQVLHQPRSTDAPKAEHSVCPTCEGTPQPERVRCPRCLGMMGHSSCTQCHGSGWITVFRGAEREDRVHKDRTHFELYKSAGEYRWRLRADNGQIIATSGEGYKHLGDCLHGLALVRRVNDDTPTEKLPWAKQ